MTHLGNSSPETTGYICIKTGTTEGGRRGSLSVTVASALLTMVAARSFSGLSITAATQRQQSEMQRGQRRADHKFGERRARPGRA